MTLDDLDRCDECGARLVNDPEQNPKRRLEALGYIAQDTYHHHSGGTTYHGHALDDDRNEHDGFGEVKQNHDSMKHHDLARSFFERAPIRCPRHTVPMEFTKSVATTGDPDEELYAQGKCPECECLGLLEVTLDGA